MECDAPQPRDHRLHASSLLFRTLAHARRYLVPALVVLLVGGSEWWEVWLGAFFVMAVAAELFSYLTVRYRLAEDELVVRQGLITKNVRNIPFSRIQNIDLVQNLLHRALGVAEVHVQTASGSEPEAVLRVLSMDAVNKMRTHVFSARARTPGTGGVADAPMARGELWELDEPAREIVRLLLPEVIRVGLTANRGTIFVAVLIGFAFEFGLLEDVEPDSIEKMVRAFVVGGGVVAVAVAVVLVLAFLVTLSVIWSVLRFYGFRLDRVADDLRISCGLFTRQLATVPRHRIQVVAVHETFLYRLMGRVAIRVETAGGIQQNKEPISRRWFVPVLPKQSLPRVLAEIQPGLTIEDVEWQTVHPRARRRMLTKAMILAVILAGVGCLIVPPWGALVFFVVAPPLAWHAVQAARLLGWGRKVGRIYFRSGVLTRKVSITLAEKLQVISTRRSPLDRRHGHSTLRIDTAGVGPADHKMHIPYMDQELARELVRELTEESELAGFRW